MPVRPRPAAKLLAGLLAAVLLSAAPAAADETVAYPSRGQFLFDQEGWTRSIVYDATCPLPARGTECPELSASWQASGGTGMGAAAGEDDGFWRIEAGPTAGAPVAQRSRLELVSPRFAYAGVGGAGADELDAPL